MLREANWSRKFEKIVDFSAIEKHLADILIPGLVKWQLCTSQTRYWLFHGPKATKPIFFFHSLPSTSLPLKQMQWCGNLPTGLQSMTV